jgi:hypothetical protein
MIVFAEWIAPRAAATRARAVQSLDITQQIGRSGTLQEWRRLFAFAYKAKFSRKSNYFVGKATCVFEGGWGKGHLRLHKVWLSLHFC